MGQFPLFVFLDYRSLQFLYCAMCNSQKILISYILHCKIFAIFIFSTTFVFYFLLLSCVKVLIFLKILFSFNKSERITGILGSFFSISGEHHPHRRRKPTRGAKGRTGARTKTREASLERRPGPLLRTEPAQSNNYEDTLTK